MNLDEKIEQVSRSLLLEQGKDPDEMVEYSDQGMEGRREVLPRWMVCAAQAEYLVARQLGIPRYHLYKEKGGYRDDIIFDENLP